MSSQRHSFSICTKLCNNFFDLVSIKNVKLTHVGRVRMIQSKVNQGLASSFTSLSMQMTHHVDDDIIFLKVRPRCRTLLSTTSSLCGVTMSMYLDDDVVRMAWRRRRLHCMGTSSLSVWHDDVVGGLVQCIMLE